MTKDQVVGSATTETEPRRWASARDVKRSGDSVDHPCSIILNPGRQMMKLSMMHKRLLALTAALPMAAMAQDATQANTAQTTQQAAQQPAASGQLETVTVTAQ